MVRTGFFWVITQRGVVIPYRRFGTTYRSCLQRSRTPPPKKERAQIETSLFGFLTLEDGTDKLSQNVGKELLLLAV